MTDENRLWMRLMVVLMIAQTIMAAVGLIVG